MNGDELFTIARQKAFDGKREEARAICMIILTRSPGYHDVRVLYGRTFAWDGKRNEAREAFRAVLAANPRFLDAHIALADVELWDDKPAVADSLLGKALAWYPNNEDLLVRKVKALKNQERYREALVFLTRLEAINPACGECATLRSEIKILSFRHIVSVSGALEHYSSVFDPMYYSSLQVSTKTGLGSVVGRLNYSHRFGKDGLQPEIDLYPKLFNGVYAYINYGYTSSSLYPLHRAGFEVYTKLPHSFEMSGGFRYLDFETSEVMIYTASVTSYYRNLMFTLRPYITPSGKSFSRSINFLVRRYFADADNYAGVNVGAGFSPDERKLQSSTGLGADNNIYLLGSQKVELMFQSSISDNLLLAGAADYVRQELSFSKGNFVNILSVQFTLKMKL